MEISYPLLLFSPGVALPTLLILSYLSHTGFLSLIYPINSGTRGSGDVPRLLAHPTASSLIPLGLPVPYPRSGTLRFPWYIEGARLFSSNLYHIWTLVYRRGRCGQQSSTVTKSTALLNAFNFWQPAAVKFLKVYGAAQAKSGCISSIRPPLRLFVTQICQDLLWSISDVKFVAPTVAYFGNMKGIAKCIK